MFEIKPTVQLLRERGIEKGGKVQKYIDSEVIRCMDPFVPFKDGFLKKSAILGTIIGSGRIKYTAPYARRNYYENAGWGNEGIQRGGRRGRLWFVRMKKIYLPDILNGAVRYSGAERKKR